MERKKLRHRGSNPGRWIQSPTLYRLSYRRREEIWVKISGIWAKTSSKITLNSTILLSKKFSDQFGKNFCFTIINFPHIFFLVNFFLSAFLQVLCLVTEKFFFKNSIKLYPFRAELALNLNLDFFPLKNRPCDVISKVTLESEGLWKQL